MLRLSGVGASHVGLVRTNNEDSAFVGPYCVLVADGVGGGEAGEIASATTAYAVATTVAARIGDDPAAVLTDAITVAQERVLAGVEADESRNGMATTLTAVVTDGSRFTLAHLGDSRGYVVRNGDLTRVTRDHTYVQDLVDEGRLDPSEVPEHPWRNVVLRTVNGQSEGIPDLIELSLVPGDRILLASDGLTDLVAEAELAHTVLLRPDHEAVPALVDAALARGGRDNITCVLATVVEGPRTSADGQLYGAVGDPANVIDLGDGPAEASESA